MDTLICDKCTQNFVILSLGPTHGSNPNKFTRMSQNQGTKESNVSFYRLVRYSSCSSTYENNAQLIPG